MSRSWAFRSVSVLVLGLVVFALASRPESVDSPARQVADAGTNAPAPELSATALEFGTVALEEASSAVLRISHPGPADSGALLIDNLFLDEMDAQQFALSHQRRSHSTRLKAST